MSRALLSLAFAVIFLGQAPTTKASPIHPHIVTILVDDWGWANVGYHRSELRLCGGTVQWRFQEIPLQIEIRPLLIERFCMPLYSTAGEHPEVQTPNIDALVLSGVEVRSYAWRE